MCMDKITVLFPVWNEGENLKIVLPVLKSILDFEKIDAEVLIIHDFPEDNSVPVALEIKKIFPQVRTVLNSYGKGVLFAVKAGIENSNTERIVLLTADDLGPLFAITKMIKLMDKGCDFVSTTRYAYGGKIAGGYLISRILSKTGNKTFRLICPSAPTDLTFGIKMFKKSKYINIDYEANPVGWSITFELTLRALMTNQKIGEVPVISLNRFFSGTSSFNMRWFKEYFRLMIWGIKELNKKKLLRKKRKVLVLK